MKTKSERYFEKVCDELEIPYERLEESEEKKPDYQIVLGETSVIVEVKEIQRNEAERKSDRLLEERGYGECLSNVPGDRVRSKIRKASPQIKRETNDSMPGVLVLFDRGILHGHLDPYNIRVAMTGLEQVYFNVPGNPGESPYATGMSHGPKRKMTEIDNTSISAIGVMYATDKGSIKLKLYHNRYAAHPLDFSEVSAHGIDQYFLEDEPNIGTSEWQKYEL